MKAHYGNYTCKRCELLGSVVIDKETYDLYYCNKELTIVANAGEEYYSGNWAGEQALVRAVHGDRVGCKPLMVAYVLAMANGLDVKDRYPINKLKLIEKIYSHSKHRLK